MDYSKGYGRIVWVDKSGISRHLKKIFESGELDEKVVVAKIATTSLHGAIPGKPYLFLSKGVLFPVNFLSLKVDKDRCIIRN